MQRGVVGLALAALLVSGCSRLAASKAPREPGPDTWPECTEARLYPLFDTAVTALTAGGIAMIVRDDHPNSNFSLIPVVPIAVGFGYSAFYGWRETRRCGRARDAYEEAAPPR